MAAQDPSTPQHPTYEEARDELVEVVRRLEAGGATLEESLSLWERGERLAAICQEWLDGARARIAAAVDEQPPVARADGGHDSALPPAAEATAGPGQAGASEAANSSASA